jgi:dihydrofolate synthase/folylpolyglutamate synthase
VEALSEAFTFSGLVAVVAISEDKDVPRILDELEPVAAQLIVTGNSSARSMEPAKLADLATSVFGPDRVTEAARLDDAIEVAVRLTDEWDAGEARGAGLPGSAAVLVTGSVVTAGDARRLLSAGAAEDPASGPA